MFSLAYGGHWKLKDVQPGSLFMLPSGGLGMMTEYGGQAYLLGSGETCCVAADTVVIVLTINDEDAAEYTWEAQS